MNHRQFALATILLGILNSIGAADLPGYIKPDAFTDKEVTLGADPWKLGGTLSMPKGDGPFPGVVFVHGSGPNSRDEAIGGTKVFVDLAGGLASRGIAVLRYDKRNNAHNAACRAMNVAEVTMEFEVIDDAVAAIELLRATPGVDPKRIYVVGHSMGGVLAPAISKRDGKLAGFVSLAGTARPIEDVIVDQFEYFHTLDKDNVLLNAQLKSIHEVAAKMKEKDHDPKLLLMGLPVVYWDRLNAASPWNTKDGQKGRILIMQGGRDYQATEKDYAEWKKAIGERPDVTYKFYDNVDHAFVEGKGKALPMDYLKSGTHVSSVVVEDLAAWLKQ